MHRIKLADLESQVRRINKITGHPNEPYTMIDGKYKATPGVYHLSGAYGGYCLHQMSNSGGGVTCPLVNYHAPKRELYNRMDSFIDGLLAAGGN